MTRTRLAFGPPEVIVERRGDGAILARSPHPLGAYARAATDWLDHWAAVAPERVFLAERERERRKRSLAQGDLCRGAGGRARHRAGACRSRTERRAAGRDPVRQQRRSRAGRARRDGRGRSLRACLGALLARRQGFRQAQGDRRHSHAGPRVRRRRRPVRASARSGCAQRGRGRRADQSAGARAARARSTRFYRRRPPRMSTGPRRKSGRTRSPSSCSLPVRPARPRASSTPTR